jgi:hypothetical protein
VRASGHNDVKIWVELAAITEADLETAYKSRSLWLALPLTTSEKEGFLGATGYPHPEGTRCPSKPFCDNVTT